MQTNLSIKYRPIGELQPHTRNARTHDAAQIQAIADAILEFGFIVPIITNVDDIIIAGHGRLAAAILLGLSQVPVIQRDDLTADQERLLMLADNSIADRSEWNADMLRVELSAMDMEGGAVLTGFAPDELDRILGKSQPAAPGPSLDESLADDVEMMTCRSCGREFPA